MDTDSTFAILKATVELLFAVSLPLLLVGLIVGVAVSLIQAATQVQEASLVFVPKLIAVALTFWFSAPWIGERVITFCREIFTQVAQVGPAGMGLIF